MTRVVLVLMAVAAVSRSATVGSASCNYKGAPVTDTQVQVGTGNVEAQCSIPIYDPSGQIGVLLAQASSGLDLSSSTQVTIAGDVFAIADFEADIPGSWSISAGVDNVHSFDTAGLPREGFIEVKTQFRGTTNTGIDISDGVHQYSFQSTVAGVILPIDLGSALQVSLLSHLQFAGTDSQKGTTQDASGATLTFNLVEEDGTTAVPLVLTPEPSTLSLAMMIALAGLALRRFWDPVGHAGQNRDA